MYDGESVTVSGVDTCDDVLSDVNDNVKLYAGNVPPVPETANPLH